MIINKCIDEGVFPGKLKIARGVPLFKKGDSDDYSNHRPVSVLPVLSRIFEVMINKRLVKFFEVNDFSQKTSWFSKWQISHHCSSTSN